MQPAPQTTDTSNVVADATAPQPAHFIGRILVADDALCTQRSEVSLFHRMHFDVDFAANGLIACEMAEKSRDMGKPYNLILMDIKMPKMNGLAATQWLRQHNWDGPIVAISVLTSDEETQRYLDAGCDDFIAKPLTEAALRRMILHNLGVDLKESSPLPAAPLTTFDKPPKFCGRLLVAEDSRCMQMRFGAILKKLGLQVDTAEDGKIACEKAEKSLANGTPYDLILMDMQMPHMDGKKATKWLRDHQWKGPIIAVSIYAMEDDHADILEAGCDDYISKPVTEANLCSVLAKHLKQD